MYAPPSFTTRRAADFESTTPADVIKSTQVGNTAPLVIVVRGNSDSADVKVSISRSRISDWPKRAFAAFSTLFVWDSP